MIEYAVMIPCHYIMERRMLIGIRDRAEAGAGVYISPYPDLLWFSGIVMSYIGIILIIYILRGIKKYLLPGIYSIIWLIILFVIKPQLSYSVIFLLIVAVTSAWFILKNRKNSLKIK